MELGRPKPVLYDPVGQAEHVETVIPVPVPYVPVAHREHTETPKTALYVPAAQFAHAEIAVIAVPVLYVPTPQVEHTETPTAEL